MQTHALQPTPQASKPPPFFAVQPKPEAAFFAPAPGGEQVQRKCASCEAMDDVVHRQPEAVEEPEVKARAETRAVQPKLTISPADDPQEHAADRMAERVMSVPLGAADGGVDGASVGADEHASRLEVDAAPAQAPVQRKCAECAIDPATPDEQVADKELDPDKDRDPDAEGGTDAGADAGTVSPKAEAGGPHAAPDDLAASLRGAQGGGRPMPAMLRENMETRFGEDFSAVRFHIDANAAQLTRSIHAQAFTYGSDVYFNPNRYDPTSRAGQLLIAHELTHVIQQKGTHPIQRKIQRAEEMDRMGNWAHTLIQKRLRDRDATLITEGGIAGATRRGAKINSAGFTDLFRSPGMVVPGVQAEIRGADGDASVTQYSYKNFLGPLSTRAKRMQPAGKIKVGPRIGVGKKWDFTHNLPSTFEVGEIKPLFPMEFVESLAYHGTAPLQLDYYLRGYENFIKQANKDIGAPIPADPKGSPIDIPETNIPDAINYKKFEEQRDTLGKDAILKGVHSEGKTTPRLWLHQNTPGVFVYFLITHPYSPKNLRPGLDAQLKALSEIKTDLHAKPGAMDAKLKREPGGAPVPDVGAPRVARAPAAAPPPAPAPRVQAKDEDNWREAAQAWEKKRSKWAKGDEAGVEKPKKFLKEQAKGVEKRAKVDKKLGTTASVPDQEQAKNIKDVRFWSSFWGRIYGALYFRFRKVFVKIEEFFGKLKEKFRKHRDNAEKLNSKGGIFDDWKKVATQVIIKIAVQVFKDMMSIAFTRFMNCINAIVEGILGRYVDSFKKDITEEFKTNEPLCCGVMAFKNDFDAEVKKHEVLITEFTDAVEKIQKWRDILSDVEVAVRVGVEVLSCGAPPGLGCLWGLVAQFGISSGLSLLTRTSYFDDYIARPAANAIMDSIVGDKLHNLMIDVMEMTPLKEQMVGLAPCARKKSGGGGGGNGIGGHLEKLDPNDPANAKARQEWEAEHKEQILKDLQTVFQKGDKTPLTEQEVNKLVKSLQGSGKTPDELKKMLQAARDPKTGKLDFDKASTQVASGTVPEPPKVERKIDYKKATQVNAFYERKIGWTPTTFIAQPGIQADSQAFADAIYDMQKATGQYADGIAGPTTTTKFYDANKLAHDATYDKAVKVGADEKAARADAAAREERRKEVMELLKDEKVQAALNAALPADDQLKKDLARIDWDNVGESGFVFTKVGGRPVFAIKTDAGHRMGLYFTFAERDFEGQKRVMIVKTGHLYALDKVGKNEAISYSTATKAEPFGFGVLAFKGQEADSFSLFEETALFGRFVEFEDTPGAASSPTPVQPKTAMSMPCDRFEREADAMADRVVQRLPVAGTQAGPTPALQAKCAQCEHEDVLQRQAAVSAPPAAATVPDHVHQALAHAGGGDAMAPSLRGDMESLFGADFSRVRVHTGDVAGSLNRDLRARAFTRGDEIFFNAGEYRPETTTGRHLLAHELAHVTQQRPDTLQRQVPPGGDGAAGKAPDCAPSPPAGSAHADYDDRSMGPSGVYSIYGAPYDGEALGPYAARSMDMWMRWRFDDLSPAILGRIHAETGHWNWRWVPQAPGKGCQATIRIPMSDIDRVVRLAGYDVKVRPAEKRERAAGLPTVPTSGGDGMNVVGATGGGSAGGVDDPAKRKKAEEAIDPTAAYNKGALGATDPPFPISMEGPDMEVPHGLGVYTARLEYERVTSDNGILLAYSMNSVQYHWEIFDITDILMRGMKLGKSMLDEARETQELARNEPMNAQAAKAADGALGQHVRNDIDELSTQGQDALRELRDPAKAAAGGSAIDVVSRAYANYLSLELLPVSAIVAAGGWLVQEFAHLLGGYSKEKEIAFPQKEGYYMVRCIAQPGPRGPDNSERRAASVRAKVVEVRKPEMLARNALGMADAVIANYQLQKIMTSDPAELARLDKKIANVNEQTSGDLVTYLTRLVAEKEEEKKHLPQWRQYAAQRELDSLNLRLAQVKDKRTGTSGARLRPQVAFTSTITGETYPLLIEISPIPVVDDQGVEVPGRKKMRLFDVTVPDREKIDREGATVEEAVANVFEIFRKNGALGPGLLFVRMPPGWAGPHEFSLRVSATGGALVTRRLQDLATLLLVLSLVVPGAGEISMAIAAGLAAERLIARAMNHTLRLDAESVTDTLSILGAVAQGAQLIGSLRVARSGKAFVGALRTADEAVVMTAAKELESAMKLGNALNATSTVINMGGVIWGDLVMINEFSELQAAEMNGTMTHTEASRQRASKLANAFLMHGVMLHGMLKPEGADKSGDPSTPTPPARENLSPEAGENAGHGSGPPETIPEAELEQRAKAPPTAATEGQPAARKDGVRARFRTPDGLHDIFILEDGRIFRCSLICSQLRDWYDPLLKRQPDGDRRLEANELSRQLEALEARAKSGEKSPELDKAIGILDVAMRKFVAPDLAREMQRGYEARPGVKPGEKFLSEQQVLGLLKFFNVDQLAKMSGPDGLPNAKAAHELSDLFAGLDKALTAADRGAMAHLCDLVAAGGDGAARTLEFLGKVERIRAFPDVVFDLAELHEAFERGDAILDHGPLQPKRFLEVEVGKYELESGKLKFEGKDGMPKSLLRPPANGAVDFVLLDNGGSLQLVLGWEHSGLSGGSAAVKGAGRFIVDKAGFVIRVDRKSGHYRPSEANLQRAVALLIDKGILMDPAVASAMNRPVMVLDLTF